MNCPICNDVRMKEVEKDGVMIDICPNCKGVWLDRGELDKLLVEVREERQSYNDYYYERERQRPPMKDYDEYHHHDSKHYPPYYKKKKKKTVLDIFGDLFD